LETDSQRVIHTEAGEQSGGTAATPPDMMPGGTKSAVAGNASEQKSASKRTEQTALQKEQHKAAVEDLQRRLAAVEAALASERQKAAEAQRALAEQRPAIVAGITDHITPWQGCYATTQLLGGKLTFILSNSGHIQALLNPPGNPKASYFVNARYPADPEQWQARAQKHSGSWWEDWRDWLGRRSGEQEAAPRELGNEQYQPGNPAPGSCVFEP
jgi:hypothetical protein